MPYLLLSRVTEATVGTPVAIPISKTAITFQALITGTPSEAVSATVTLHGSNDPAVTSGVDVIGGASALLATFSLSGTTASEGLAGDSGVWTVSAPYAKYWAAAADVTGVGAEISVIAVS
jgi:hypothetical protein